MLDAPLRRIRTWTARRFLTRVHRATHRMPIELREPRKGRVLLVAPHMDDCVISSGGTLARHRKVGSEVGVVYTSDSRGDPQYTGVASETTVRMKEARAAMDALGASILGFLGFPDRGVDQHEPALALELARIVTAWAPTEVLCPFPGDAHRDHQATAASTAAALVAVDETTEVWAYEVWSTLWPNVAVDISAEAPRKRELIDMFASQARALPYADSALALNRYRGFQVRRPFAEAFHVTSARAFANMCLALGRI